VDDGGWRGLDKRHEQKGLLIGGSGARWGERWSLYVGTVRELRRAHTDVVVG
jgi:hypothetical protein